MIAGSITDTVFLSLSLSSLSPFRLVLEITDYSKMMQLTDDLGRKVFRTIEITLVCDDCLKTDHPER